MSTFWTPDGERPVNPSTEQPSQSGGAHTPTGFSSDAPTSSDPSQEAPSEEQMEKLREQLSQTPAAIVIANHCFGLFELAALHLSVSPPQLSEAQLAIDALAALVESLTGRLGEGEPQLREGLNQLRLAFVQIRQNNSEN